MAIEPINTKGPTITVSSEAELANAYEQLSITEGGGTILLEPGFYGSFAIYNYGETVEEQPVVIKSVDETNPAEFSGLYLREVSNLRIEKIFLDGSDNLNGRDEFDVTVQDATNIQIVDSVFVQDVENVVKDAGGLTDSGVWIRDSDNVLFQGNYMEGQFNALQVQNTTNTDIIGNEFTDIQGDGFRGGGLQNVTIAGNYMHDFYVVNQHITHSDMIQVWGSNSYLLTENLTVTGNTLIASDGATQGIFIKNEEFGKPNDSTSGYLKNIAVTDNLVYNGHLHGIRVDDTDGVLIDNNTVLWNPDAWQQWGDADPVNWEPIIRLENSINTKVTDNITSGLDLLDSTVQSNNKIVTYDDPSKLSYVENHFVDPLAGADVSVADVFVLPTSSFYGEAGSRIGNYPDDYSDGAIANIRASVSETDKYKITFDANQSTDMDGNVLSGSSYSYHWTFADGSTATGLTVNKEYESGGFKGVELEIRQNGTKVAEIDRNVGVESKDIFNFNFEDGAFDLSNASPNVVDNGTLVDSHDGSGYLIGDGNKLEIDRYTEELFSLDTFGIAMDLTPTGDERSGTFLHQYQTMEAKVHEDGTFSFSLITDEGTFSLTSREPVFVDGDMHRIGIAYDGNTGQLELFADGKSVSETDAWGTTAPMQSWGLVVGNTWNDSMDAIIDNLVMSEDPAVAGDLPDVSLPVDEPELPVDEPEQPVDEPEPPVDEPEPWVEEPNDPGERGIPRDPVENDGSSNFLSDLLDMLLSIFGLGGDDDKLPVIETAAARIDLSLDQLVPITDSPEDDLPEDPGEEEDIFDMAA